MGWEVCALAAAVIIAVGIIILILSNCFIDVTVYPIQADRDLKILHLSDLHKKKFGRNYKRLFKKILREKYDMICFTGDLISRSERDFSKKLEFMKNLKKIAPVYYIGGNHECDVPEFSQRLYEELEKEGVFVLRNQTRSFVKNGVSTEIAGLEPEGRFFKNKDGSYKKLPPMTVEYLRESLGEKSEGFTVLLAHSPFPFESYCGWGAELILCGHVHGGAIRLPFVKGILSPERKFFPKYSGGKFQNKNSVMIVSRGLGKLRVFNNPEIVVIDLKKR